MSPAQHTPLPPTQQGHRRIVERVHEKTAPAHTTRAEGEPDPERCVVKRRGADDTRPTSGLPHKAPEGDEDTAALLGMQNHRSWRRFDCTANLRARPPDLGDRILPCAAVADLHDASEGL